jgi:hypothetical protein
LDFRFLIPACAGTSFGFWIVDWVRNTRSLEHRNTGRRQKTEDRGHNKVKARRFDGQREN